MKLRFKQRVFSWFGSFEIYDDAGSLIYTVKGKPSWGRRLLIYDAMQQNVGEIKQKLSLLPQFQMIQGGEVIAVMKRKMTLRHTFEIEELHWLVSGNFLAWDIDVTCQGARIMHASKEVLHIGATYVLDIAHSEDALSCLMVILTMEATIEAAKKQEELRRQMEHHA